MEFADFDKKRKEERKRQLELINYKRDLRRLQMSHEPRKRPHVGAGGSKPSNIRKS